MVINLHRDDPRELADFIAKQRPALEKAFGAPGIASMEIQALANAQDATSARLLLQQHREQFDEVLVALLEAEIAKADGRDPVSENKQAYEATKSVERCGRSLPNCCNAGTIMH